jgi:hypothetical protein
MGRNVIGLVSAGSLPDPEIEPTVDLWPTAGKALGLGRSATYAAATRGEIPGLLRVGGLWRVATATLRKTLGLGE